MNTHNQAILKAMIAAAKADGQVDEREQKLIRDELNRLGADTDIYQLLLTELEKPLDLAEVVRAATTPEMASEMYQASLLVVGEQNVMERAHLDELARQLKLEDGLKAYLESAFKGAESVA